MAILDVFFYGGAGLGLITEELRNFLEINFPKVKKREEGKVQPWHCGAEGCVRDI